MTADISIDVAVVGDALRIPNAALHVSVPGIPGIDRGPARRTGRGPFPPGPSAPGRMGGPPSSGGAIQEGHGEETASRANGLPPPPSGRPGGG